MLWLSDEAVQYAVAKCRNTAGYRIGIAVSNASVRQNLDHLLRELLEDRDNYRIRRNGGHTIVIEFGNGSYIRTLPASEYARGYRVHLLIADENINDEVLNCVLRPLETLEHIERMRRLYNEPDPEAGFYAKLEMCDQEYFDDDDNSFEDVSESEFMKILNIPIPQ